MREREGAGSGESEKVAGEEGETRRKKELRCQSWSVGEGRERGLSERRGVRRVRERVLMAFAGGESCREGEAERMREIAGAGGEERSRREKGETAGERERKEKEEEEKKKKKERKK